MDLSKQAIQNGELIVYFQSIVNSKDMNIYGYEALSRMRLANGEVAKPSDFLSKILESDRKLEFMKSVFFYALSFIERNNCPVFINMDSKQLCSSSMREIVYDVFSRFDMTVTSLIRIEILESEKITDYKSFRNKMDVFRKFKVKFSIDGFGTSYSNIERLSNFDFDYLKIDNKFTKNMLTKKDYFIVKSMIQVCKKLNIKIIVEHIEDSFVLNTLSMLNVDFMQGSYFSEPKPWNMLNS